MEERTFPFTGPDELNAQEEKVPVSSMDKLTEQDSGEKADSTRRFGEYRPSNVPLPAVEVNERAKCGWMPRKISRLHDVIPIEEHDPLTTDERREIEQFVTDICRAK